MKWLAAILCGWLALACPARAVVDDARSLALEAATPFVKDGFVVRDDFWSGELRVKQTRSIPLQLYKGNAYWFWMGADGGNTRVSVHIRDGAGRLVEKIAWSRPVFDGSVAAAFVVPERSGTYYLNVTLDEAPVDSIHWSVVYGFR